MAERIIKRIDKATLALPTLSQTDSPYKRVAAYARVSTASEEQLNSVEAQKDYFEKMILQHEGWILVGVYADEGISGTSIHQRKAFLQMIEDAMAGKIDLIITKSISRFARNTVDSLNVIRQLKARNVEVFFEKEYIETALYLISTPNTGLFFVYCSICCGFSGYSETVYCVLSLICRLNLQTDTER